MSDWYDDDKFWESFQDYMFNPRRMAATLDEVDGLARMLELKRGSAVLDLCCGFGRHSLEFARRGMRVTGVDRTAAYLAQARATAAKESLDVEFVQSDMRKFVRPAAFDGAINYFTAFGYFDDPADDQKVAQNLFDSLRPGGRLIVDVNGKEVLAARFRERDWNRLADGRIVLEERRIVDGWKRIENRWVLIDGSTRREKTLTLRLYSGGELESLLRAVGFSEVALYGNLECAPYDEKEKRLIALARK
jgi:SAM-dependent methyltransferase